MTIPDDPGHDGPALLVGYALALAHHDPLLADWPPRARLSAADPATALATLTHYWPALADPRARAAVFVHLAGQLDEQAPPGQEGEAAAGVAVAVWLAAATEHTATGDRRAAAAASYNAAIRCADRGWYPTARALYRAARATFAHLDLDRDVAGCDYNLGYVAHMLSEHREARACYRAARATFARLSLDEEVAGCDLSLGHVAQAVAEHGEARRCYQAARAVYDRLDLAREVAACDLGLGNVALALAEHGEARRLYQAARAGYAQLGLAGQVAGCDLNLGNVARELAKYGEARACYQAARAGYARLGLARDVAGCDHSLGTVAQLVGKDREARRLYQAARAGYAQLGLARQVAECDNNLGGIARELGEHGEARRLYRAARATFARLGLARKVADCDDNLGNVAHELGEHGEARARLEAAVAAFARLGLPVEQARTQVGLAGPLATTGDLAGAVRLVVPAVLALDAVRFRLASPQDRHGWARTIAWAYRVAFRLAAAVGDGRLVAELVESARANGVPRLDPEPDGDAAAGALGVPLTDAAATAQPRAEQGPPVSWAGPAGAAGDPEVAVGLGPPPVVVLPWGEALAAYWPAAERLVRPVRDAHRVALTRQLLP